VTHFWRHAVWLEEGELLRGVERLAGIPAVLVHGRLDVSSPLDVAWELSQAWEGSELHLVDDEGHGLDEVTARLVVAATDGFAHRFPEDAG
jgi:proline iminopeptidase